MNQNEHQPDPQPKVFPIEHDSPGQHAVQFVENISTEQQLIAENERLKKANIGLLKDMEDFEYLSDRVENLEKEIARLNKLLSSYQMTSK